MPNERLRPLENIPQVKHNPDYFGEQPIYFADGTNIPRSVLIEILRVFVFGKHEDLLGLNNNTISDKNGDHWTTWEEVMNLRRAIIGEYTEPILKTKDEDKK